MAFRYIDGFVYESNFHFWYLNGVRPDPALKMEIEPRELPNEGQTEVKDSRFVYEGDGQTYGDIWEFRYVNGRLPETEKMRPVISTGRSKEVVG